MKKIIFTVAALFALTFANAQEDGGFKIGANVGIPMGDIKDLTSLAVGVDAVYSWSISDKFSAGVGAGYAHYLGKSIDTPFGSVDTEDAGFVPVYGTAQYSVSDNFFLGADLGYGLAISPSNLESGILYQPKVGYQTEKFELFLGYKGISVDGGTFSSVNLGFFYKL